jgi:hypothetical protein
MRLEQTYQHRLERIRNDMDRFISYLVKNGYDHREPFHVQVKKMQSSIVKRISLAEKLAK